jgi:DNA-binding NarL/FixJ family response regulator
VLYTGHRDRALLDKALEVGASGFVLKEAALYRLLEALRIVADGGVYVDPELSAALASSRTVAALSPLTPREREILLLLADGMTNERAASTLGISAETVQSHVRNAMGKLEADTRTEAVATALRESLIA